VSRRGAVAGYLAACVVAGAVLGRAFGRFVRAGFHYPARASDVSAAHRALLDALDVVEWPGLFVLTLLAALALWRWLRPRSLPPAPPATRRARATAFAACLAVAVAVTVPQTRPGGRLLAALAAAASAAVAASLLGRLRAEARAASRPFAKRLAAQLPVVTGHLAATAAASMSLGYRGESALVHGIGLVVGIALFGVELVWCLLTAAVTGAGRKGRPGAASG
jgi:hypothetical protein